jgi:hypothetical protein
MSEKKKSKEERFLLKLHELAEASGDPENEVDRYEVGSAIGVNPKGTDHSVQMLTKNNFIKKSEDNLIYLTPLGCSFLKNNFLS